MVIWNFSWSDMIFPLNGKRGPKAPCLLLRDISRCRFPSVARIAHIRNFFQLHVTEISVLLVGDVHTGRKEVKLRSLPVWRALFNDIGTGVRLEPGHLSYIIVKRIHTLDAGWNFIQGCRELVRLCVAAHLTFVHCRFSGWQFWFDRHDFSP